MKNYGYVKTKRDFVAKQYAKKGASSFFKKLGNSLVAVVVVLPVAGLFAAIGGIIMSKGTSEGLYTFGLILADLGQTVLSNLGLLFMFAILLGFTNTKGYALFAAAIGYIGFIGFITPFIRYNGNPADPNTSTFNIWFWKNLEIKTQLANVFGLGQQALSTDPGVIGKHGEFARLSYEGFTTLNTGVLGGIVLGFVFTWVYNHGKNLKLPNMLSFFSGEKFSSVVSLCLTPVIASLFIIIWPGVNWVLGEIGVGLTKLPYALDAFFFGIVKQLLIPFEAHQAVIAPLWYTQAGGSLSQSQPDVIAVMIYRLTGHGSAGIGQEGNWINQVQTWAEGVKGTNNVNLWDWITGTFKGGTFDKDTIVKLVNDFDSAFKDTVELKSSLTSIEGSLSDYAAINWSIAGDQLMTMEVLNNHPEIDINDFWSSNLKITRFITGGYANLMFLTPAVGFAMWSTLSKDARKRKMGFYVGAILPSFILGVNEPVIFMFAYTAPLIYYVAYSGICGVLFLFTALFQAKLGSTFSQGLVDYVVNGIIPTVTRTDGVSQTQLWIPLVIGVITFVLGFVIFRWLFIQLEFVAPGMEDETYSDVKGKSIYSTTKPVVTGFLDYFNNVKNIKSLEWQDGVLVISLKETFEYKKNEYADRYFEKISVDKDNNIYIQPNDKDKYDFIRAINYVQALVSLRTTKHGKLNEKQKTQQRINKVEAKWQIRHDSLDTTTDVEKVTEQYKEQYWTLLDMEQRELAKAQGKQLKPLPEKTKQQAKQLTKDYKQQVKQLKIANKQKIKAERGVKAKTK